MRAWREFQQIQSVNGYQFHTRKISECLFYSMIFVVYNQRTSSHNVSSVPHFSFPTSDLFRLLAFLDIIICTQCFQQRYSCFGFGEAFDGVCADDWNFRDVVNLVSSCHQQGRDSTGCQCRAHCISPLFLVNGTVPSAPGFSWGEHASTSAHVTKGSLTGSVSTTTTHTRNTGNSTSGSPGLSRCLMSSMLVNSIRSTTVLGHVGMNEMYYIRTNGCLEYCG